MSRGEARALTYRADFGVALGSLVALASGTRQQPAAIVTALFLPPRARHTWADGYLGMPSGIDDHDADRCCLSASGAYGCRPTGATRSAARRSPSALSSKAGIDGAGDSRRTRQGQ